MSTCVYEKVSPVYSVEGYEFVGWAVITEDENYDPVVDLTKIIQNLTFADGDDTYIALAAVWQTPKDKYDVIYYSDTDKATSIDTQAQPAGNEVVVGLTDGVVVPTKTGYTLDGWSCVTDGVTVSDGKFTMPENVVEFVPEWEVNEYRVTYSVTGAPADYTVPAEKTVAYGTEVTVEAAPNVTGYDFAGWTTSDVTVADGKFTMPDKAVTLTGTFTAKNYNVIYYTDTDKATALDTQSKQYTTEVTVGLSSGKNNPTKTGYTFKGWTTADATVTGGKFTMPAKNVEFVPEWEVNEYNLKYETGVPAGTTVTSMPSNESNIEYELVKNGYALDDTTVPQRTGYTFAGWKVGNVDNATKAQFSDFDNADMTAVATAQWTENVYNIVYNPNSPTGVDSDVADVPNKVELTYIQLVAGYTLGGSPKCDRFNFMGWSKTTSGAVVTDVDFADLPANSDTINVYATWKNAIAGANVVYLAGFNKQYQSDISGEYVDVVDDIRVPYEVLPNTWFIREGYTFDGWIVTDENGKVRMIDSLANILSISDIGDKLNPGDTTTLDGDTYFAVDWELNQYNIKYNSNTTDEVTSMPKDETGLNVEDGFNLNADKNQYIHTLSKTVPKRTGYKFLGWSLSPSSPDCIKQVATTNFTSDTLTVYAVWESIKYQVKYDKNNSVEGTAPVDPNEYMFNDTATVLDKGDLKYNEYTFKEWNTDKNGKCTGYKPGDTFNMPNSDVTLYAIWVNDEGTIVSPGTGEGSMGIILAVLAMIISMSAGTVVVYSYKRRRHA